MTRTIRAHFDGRVIVPDEPLDLPVNEPLQVQVTAPATGAAPAGGLAASPAERGAAVDRLLSKPVQGLNLPDAALGRESIYGDE